MSKTTKDYKGYIMLFGLFRIRRDFSFWMQCGGSPYASNYDYWPTLEPLLQKICTIKWIEMEKDDKEIAYAVRKKKIDKTKKRSINPPPANNPRRYG